MGVVIRTERDLGSGVTTVWLSGELTLAAVSGVGAALAMCVRECPVAVIVELSALRGERSGVLGVLGISGVFGVFPTAARRARARGVPLLWCAAGPGIAGPLAASGTAAQAYTSLGDAWAAVRDAGPRWVHARMTPTPDSASLARALVGDACLAWNVPGLYDAARVVVSELASNAIEHTAADFEVTAARVGGYLRIGVQDYSRVVPGLLMAVPPHPQGQVPDRGRGLPIVQSLATHWGTTALDDGKIVWALLLADAVSAMSAVAGDVCVADIRPERLTEREVEVVRYLPTILTLGEIATELDVSVAAVKAHLKSVYRKLDVSRRREAVDRVSGLGLIAPASPADERPRRRPS